MVELDRIVDFYGEAMTVLELSEKRYSLNVHRIRYEDLVLDMKLEVSNLLMFLELGWENELGRLPRDSVETWDHKHS